MIKRIIFIILAFLALSIGVLGIFVPGLPTTPLLLLSLWLFSRSSKRFHDMLLNSKYIGTYIRRFKESGGMTWRRKLFTLIIMWSMITLSTTVFIKNNTVDYIVIALGVIGSISILKVVKTLR